jgi:uncharacterized protein (TIGR00251 family)
MKINVKVIPNSKMILVEGNPDGHIKVKLTAPANKGKANQQLIEILANHYNVKKSKVKILKGHTSHDKLVEIDV